MKNTTLVIAVILIVLIGSGIAYANSASDTLGILITVSEKFTFAIGEGTVDMGTAQTGYGSVTAYCSTNRGNEWYIQVKATSPFSNGTVTIPLSLFKFYTYGVGEQAGEGTYVTTPTEVALTDKVAYTAAPSEYSDTDVRVCIGMMLLMPSNQMAGTYSTSVIATMTE